MGVHCTVASWTIVYRLKKLGLKVYYLYEVYFQTRSWLKSQQDLSSSFANHICASYMCTTLVIRKQAPEPEADDTSNFWLLPFPLKHTEAHWYQGSYINLSGYRHLKVSGGRHLKVSGGHHLKLSGYRHLKLSSGRQIILSGGKLIFMLFIYLNISLIIASMVEIFHV